VRSRPLGHAPPVLRIDPAAPPLWRTPDSLQLGHDPALAVVDPVPPGAEQVVHALVAGASRRHLETIAAAAGLDDLDGLLTAVRPALVRGTRTSAPLRLAIDGPDDLAALLAPLLGPIDPAPDVAVVVAHHLVRPAETVRRLAEDLPHVALVFGDQAAVVGPFVVPGRTPCLRCAEEHRLDADPARRAIAAQLLRRGPARTASSIRTRLIAFEALGDALDAVRETGASGLEGVALRITPDGAVSRERRPWHERCSCRWQEVPPSPAPRGSATGAAPPAAAPPTAPTTAGSDRAPA
jgi:hypothetical protein